MKKLATILVMAILFVTSGSISARADVSGGAFIVKAGVLSPNGTNLLNSNSAFSAGAEYEFNMQGQDKNTTWSLTGDYTQAQRLDGGTSAVIPLIANYKWYCHKNGDTRAFFGLGAGAILGDFSGFAYQGMAGLQFSHNWQFEVRYIGDTGNQKVGAFGTQLNSLFGADLGYRF